LQLPSAGMPSPNDPTSRALQEAGTYLVGSIPVSVHRQPQSSELVLSNDHALTKPRASKQGRQCFQVRHGLKPTVVAGVLVLQHRKCAEARLRASRTMSEQHQIRVQPQQCLHCIFNRERLIATYTHQPCLRETCCL
jgi:hypothetical protein